jgi:DNA repair protein RecO (recombination protein O)
MIYQQKGIMIRQTNYSETSRIITILNQDGERIPLMARGFNKPKSPFIVLRQGFREVLFTYNRFKGMGTLNEVDIIQQFKKVNNDFDLYACASYMMEIVIKGMDEDTDFTTGNFYNLAIKGLELLEAGHSKKGVLALIAIKMLPYYGAQLNVDQCAICGNRNYKQFSHYSFKYHGVLCNNCLTDETLERSNLISNRVLYLAAYMKNAKLDSIESVKINEENSKMLLKFIELIYDEYVGVFFKSRKMVDMQ